MVSPRAADELIGAERASDREVLVFEGIGKEFRAGLRGRVRALDGVSLRIGPGEIFGLLGHNGAGKTTLLKLALGLLRPSAGGGRLLGRPLGDRLARARVGYQPEQPYLYPFLTVAETLGFLGELSRIPRGRLRDAQGRTARQCGLEPVLRTQVRHLSRGWLQRLALAGALLPDPDLLLLDEPLSGLDPDGRLMVKRLIRSLRAAGRTILINTHYLPDIEKLADRVALLRDGRLVACGAMSELLDYETGACEFELVGAARPVWLDRGEIVWERRAERRLLWRVTGMDDQRRHAMLRDLIESGLQVIAMNPLREDLEGFFSRVAGTPSGAVERERGSARAA
ncbi:MAG: ABC transporter ATP-binding protein [Candidatus Eisenbacteria sp.]|nr:ABC transporter ATP-binding protein [Candidatus Eisenbacteria bacterium]